jgi:hypothetical protein
MNLYGYLVGKNEQDRYLQECLEEFSEYVDGLFVYDDRSEDQEMLQQICDGIEKVTLRVRPEEAVSFMENEALFREQAWDYMQATFKPTD